MFIVLIDYEEMQKFYDWVGKNPVLGTLRIIGFIAILIVILYISQRLDKWELMRRNKKNRY